MNLPKPIKRQKQRKRLNRLPRCKDCCHSWRLHVVGKIVGACTQGPMQCYCEKYMPARGKRQKAKTPEKILREKCDDAWARLVKINGRCEISKPHKCANGLQAMHGIPRTYKVTRHLPINGFAGCGGIHKYYTERPAEWSAYLVEAWGLETFRELWNSARSMQPVDLSLTYQALQSELARRTA